MPTILPTEGQVQPPTSQVNLTGMGMGGFLAELKGMLLKGGPKKASIPTPVPRRFADKWRPVLGKPTVSAATAASVLIHQQKARETGTQPISSTVLAETGVDTPGQLEGPSASASTPVGPDVQPVKQVDPDASDSTQVAMEANEDMATGVVESA